MPHADEPAGSHALLLPEVAGKLKESLRSRRNQPDSNFDRVQKAPFNIKDYVFVGGLRLAEIWRLLLGAPMLMAIKAVCDRVDE